MKYHLLKLPPASVSLTLKNAPAPHEIHREIRSSRTILFDVVGGVVPDGAIGTTSTYTAWIALRETHCAEKKPPHVVHTLLTMPTSTGHAGRCMQILLEKARRLVHEVLSDPQCHGIDKTINDSLELRRKDLLHSTHATRSGYFADFGTQASGPPEDTISNNESVLFNDQ